MVRSIAMNWVALVLVACASPAPVKGSPHVAETRNEAIALVMAKLAADQPGVHFVVKEELRGGGLQGPFVFAMTPPAGPFLVEVGTSDVIVLKPMATTRLSVNDWELKKYGVLQR